METLILALFAAMLLGCVFLGKSVLFALIGGLALFSIYAAVKGASVQEILRMWADGILTAKNVLITFCIIGCLTGAWRAGGTIPAIVYYAAGLIRPSIFVLLTFLLNSGLSFLMGTSFGTAATMGLICMTIAHTLGISPVLTGGAVLSGIYFGDRCSPVSTSALLVAEITGTDLYDNIRNMVLSAVVPFLVSCAFYAVAGMRYGGVGAAADVRAVFAAHFDVSWPMLLPAAVILALAAFRVPVKKTLLASLLASLICCAVFQKLGAGEILRDMIFGYRADEADLGRMLDGGGLKSMLRTGVIVLIASCYSGIFRKTPLLRGLKGLFARLAGRTNVFTGILGAGVLSAAIACNQTLAIMLTEQLCEDFAGEKESFALALEDTVVVIAAVIPWSIACAAALSFIGAPMASIAFAVYLFLLPASHLLRSFGERGKSAPGAVRRG